MAVSFYDDLRHQLELAISLSIVELPPAPLRDRQKETVMQAIREGWGD